MSKNNEESLDLYDLVYDYLHESWDPIGVKAFGEPAGEYANYVDDIVLLIIRKVSLKDLANHLQKLVEEQMGIDWFPRNSHQILKAAILTMKYFLSIIWIVFVVNSSNAQLNKLSIRFQPYWGDQKITLHQKIAFKNTGDSVVFSKAKFYVNHLSFWSGTQKTNTEEVYLIDLENNEIIEISTLQNQVDKIQFLLGTDSVMNVAGAMGGNLDPIHGMYWTWQSGYINVKIEGEYFLKNGDVEKFVYHLGGYKAPYASNLWIERNSLAKSNDFEIQCQFQNIIEDRILQTDFNIMTPSLKSKQMLESFGNSFFIK